MRLLFDIGNTRIKWAFDDGDKLVGNGEVVHRGRIFDEFVGIFDTFSYQADSAWAVNVAGESLETLLQAALMQHLGLELQVARTGPECGAVRNGYTEFEQLGADRWAAVVGAWELYHEAVCVIDVGTAVTIDVVEADGQHRGGIIVPGLNLMSAALLSDTSDIQSFANSSRGPVPGDDWFGRDTLSAVNRGALFSVRAAIVQATRELDGYRLVLTGGDAEALLPLPGVDPELRPALVLEGLRYLSGAAD